MKGAVVDDDVDAAAAVVENEKDDGRLVDSQKRRKNQLEASCCGREEEEEEEEEEVGLLSSVHEEEGGLHIPGLEEPGWGSLLPLAAACLGLLDLGQQRASGLVQTGPALVAPRWAFGVWRLSEQAPVAQLQVVPTRHP